MNIAISQINAAQEIGLATPIGTPIAGGHLVGFIKSSGGTFALIVAPKATGDTVDRWNATTTRVEGADSLCDGLANTQAMAAAGSTLARTVLALSIAGYQDWYLPSRDELELIYRNLKPTARSNYACDDGANDSSVPPGAKYSEESPAQTAVEAFLTGGDQAMVSAWYWSSTQYAADPSYAWDQIFNDGLQDYYHKSYEGRARAVRRVRIQSFDNSVAKAAPTTAALSTEVCANLVGELQKAERIIIAMLGNMTDDQQQNAHRKLQAEGVVEEGMTRFHERRAALTAAGAP